MRYVGFGEHGGTSIYKNAAQLVFFNYDNITYSQVYNQGALDDREPLYHADPFFCGFDSTAGRDQVYGIFVDNAGQVCLDVGKESADKLLLGTRFNDMDYYFVLGDNPAQVLTDYTALVGRPRLKPRYALGYHQVSHWVTRGNSNIMLLLSNESLGDWRNSYHLAAAVYLGVWAAEIIEGGWPVEFCRLKVAVCRASPMIQENSRGERLTGDWWGPNFGHTAQLHSAAASASHQALTA